LTKDQAYFYHERNAISTGYKALEGSTMPSFSGKGHTYEETQEMALLKAMPITSMRHQKQEIPIFESAQF
jgi:hypothetical protein